MKTTIQVCRIFHSGVVTGRHSGRLLREAVSNAVDNWKTAVVDFSGVEVITQSAADEFVGRIVRERITLLDSVRFSNCSKEVADLLQWAAENADSTLSAEIAQPAA